MGATEFKEDLFAWFEQKGRSFYWRSYDLEPFEILVTEMLLKRTKAETVDAMMPEILDSFSSPKEILGMDETHLKEILRPLGLHKRRSKNLRFVCEELVRRHDGVVPDNREDLLSINGIGEYIADAVLCFAYEKPVLTLDTNVARVANFYFEVEVPDDLRQDTEIRKLLEPLVPKNHPQKFNWALIDLGNQLQKKQDPLGQKY
jgi:A/G-specific adenine glycosylase